jgi:hypothetical protein
MRMSAGGAVPSASIPGPSRRITVEPLTVPAPSQPAPAVAPPDPSETDPREVPAVEPDPVPLP